MSNAITHSDRNVLPPSTHHTQLLIAVSDAPSTITSIESKHHRSSLPKPRRQHCPLPQDKLLCTHTHTYVRSVAIQPNTHTHTKNLHLHTRRRHCTKYIVHRTPTTAPIPATDWNPPSSIHVHRKANASRKNAQNAIRLTHPHLFPSLAAHRTLAKPHKTAPPPPTDRHSSNAGVHPAAAGPADSPTRRTLNGGTVHKSWLRSCCGALYAVQRYSVEVC